MASTRQVKTPGAAPETTVDEEVKTTESETTEQQPADQAQTSDTGSETETTVDQAALIEELRLKLEAAENKNKSLEGQLRRTTPVNTSDMAKAETAKAGTPYLSPKGWTRGA
ncbi:hypothetical protein KWE42_16060 [Acinetobacter pittii]|uniref:Uncharacterized protein n=1 Tax=Acinetobacter pittii TaxID=48296 RepID=A0AAE9MAS0_ACIPI|nr:hypothetical protein [Acinetobacter pittii]AZP28416.1 hypothetical protein DLK06_04620 [Acinetobacter pittii]USU95551.1 hypothetical protein MWH18_04615 [Acinetobacter pittii]